MKFISNLVIVEPNGYQLYVGSIKIIVVKLIHVDWFGLLMQCDIVSCDTWCCNQMIWFLMLLKLLKKKNLIISDLGDMAVVSCEIVSFWMASDNGCCRNRFTVVTIAGLLFDSITDLEICCNLCNCWCNWILLWIMNLLWLQWPLWCYVVLVKWFWWLALWRVM